MESLLPVIDVLVHEDYFSFDFIYMLSMTCIYFNGVYSSSKTFFTKRIESVCTDNRSRISFTTSQTHGQISLKYINSGEVFTKRIHFRRGRDSNFSAHALRCSELCYTNLKRSQRLHAVIPKLVGEKYKLSLLKTSCRKSSDLIHYTRLLRKKVLPQLKEKLFIRTYNGVLASYSTGRAFHKSLKSKYLRADF
jgi:hypothetical protein